MRNGETRDAIFMVKLTFAKTKAAAAMKGVHPIINKVISQDTTNPTTKPPRKVAVNWIKILNLSPIPSCTLIVSLYYTKIKRGQHALATTNVIKHILQGLTL